MITGNRGLFHLLALARIYTKINNVALLLPSLVVVWVQINWLLYVSPYMPRGRLPQRNHKGDGFLFLSFVIPTKSCIPPKIATSECYFGLTLVPADKACLPQPKNVQIPATLPTASACAICLQNLLQVPIWSTAMESVTLAAPNIALADKSCLGTPPYLIIVQRRVPNHCFKNTFDTILSTSIHRTLWIWWFGSCQAIPKDSSLMLLNSKENDERAGREGDSFCSENVTWKVFHGKYGPLRIVMGYFWAFPCGYLLNQKLRLLLLFPPRNMWWHREDVYPKWFFSANQLVFSPDAKSVAMGAWRSCEMMVDFGFTEKPPHSLFPKQTGMAADYPKMFLIWKPSFMISKDVNIFKVFICL